MFSNNENSTLVKIVISHFQSSFELFFFFFAHINIHMHCPYKTTVSKGGNVADSSEEMVYLSHVSHRDLMVG